MTLFAGIINSNNRNEEKSRLFNSLKNSINTLVFGPHGIGKTTLIKTVAEEYNSKFGQAIYIDCSLYQTANAILREILLSLGSVIASKSNYELAKRLNEKTRKLKLVIFLDHFENLRNYEILSLLLGLGFCLCLVSDSFESYRKMNLTLRSKIANLMKIEKLSRDQISEIVKERIDPTVSDELLHKVMEKSDGNLTLTLNVLRSVEVNQGKSDIELMGSENTLSNISNEDYSVILQILRQQKRFPSGELYSLYSDKSEFPKSERSFRKYMQALCKQGLVRSIGDKKGRSYELIETKSEENMNVE
jgi:replication-associated recombination protein RarA